MERCILLLVLWYMYKYRLRINAINWRLIQLLQKCNLRNFVFLFFFFCFLVKGCHTSFKPKLGAQIVALSEDFAACSLCLFRPLVIFVDKTNTTYSNKSQRNCFPLQPIRYQFTKTNCALTVQIIPRLATAGHHVTARFCDWFIANALFVYLEIRTTLLLW